MVPDNYVVYVDGSSRGNPGPAGIGIVIFNKDNKENPVDEISRFIGRTTNNVAEYEALICALKWLVNKRADSAIIKMDSELIYNQIIGNYRVRSKGMLRLKRRIQEFLQRVNNISFELIPRRENRFANHLAQKASSSVKK